MESTGAIPADPQPQSPRGGQILADITNQIVSLVREHYGRGPIRAKTYLLENLVVCVMFDGMIPIEKTMSEAGKEEELLGLRREFQVMMRERYSELVEKATGRKVLAFLSQTHVEPDLTVEMFLLEAPVPGFAALELVEPG